MATNIPAAQYLRMSTDHQQFSLESQAAAIQRYAQMHGFEVVQSYEDSAKSGLTLKHRDGLGRLLQDVFSGKQTYGAILVYDVSRWGRFQDTDEAAHYEFICKSSGVPVHYCAETFANDGTPPSAIMKALKRVMAGEYSRELSVRISRAKRIMTQAGWWAGGPAPFGLRRMLISFDGSRKQLLREGESKSVAGGHVVLAPGTTKDVARVREIYRLTIVQKKSTKSIAQEFNRKGSKCCGREWTYGQVLAILKNPKYTGCATWGRTSGILGAGSIRVPREQWTVKPGAFEAIVDQNTFNAAQRTIKDHTCFNTESDEELLDGLRRLLGLHGSLSSKVINRSREVPSAGVYRRRFGSLRQAYERIGYRIFENRQELWRMRHWHQRLQNDVIRRILKAFRGEVSLTCEKPRLRQMLCFREGLKVSVLLSQCITTSLGGLRWRVPVVAAEKDCVTLICRCAPDNRSLKDYYLVPNVDRTNRFHIKDNDQWLKRGKRLTDLAAIAEVGTGYAVNPRTDRRIVSVSSS